MGQEGRYHRPEIRLLYLEGWQVRRDVTASAPLRTREEREAAAQIGGFIATSSITLGRISRRTPRNVASSEAVAQATRRREPRRRTRAVARPSSPGRIVANT